MTKGASLFYPTDEQRPIYKRAYNFLNEAVKDGRATQKQFNAVIAEALKGGSKEQNVNNLIDAAREITWVDKRGMVKSWGEGISGRHPEPGVRSGVVTTIKRALDRADRSGVRNLKAEELYSEFNRNPLFPSPAQVDEIMALRTKGPGIESEASGTDRRTIRKTPESPVVSERLGQFDRAVERTNYRINRLVKSEKNPAGILTQEQADYFRQSRGHGIPKGQHGYPNLRNLSSDIFLVPNELNNLTGASLTQKDIYQYIRMLSRMERAGQHSGTSAEGLKRLYELNDLLIKNNLEPIKDLEYFKGLPRVKDYRPIPTLSFDGKEFKPERAIGRVGQHLTDVDDVVKKSLMNLNVGGARGKVLKRLLLSGSALTGALLSTLGQAQEGPSILDPVDDFSNVMPSKSGWFGRVAPMGTREAEKYIDKRQARLDEERRPLTESELQAQQNRAAVGGFLSEYGPMFAPIMSSLLPSHEWDVAYSKGGEGSEQGWRRRLLDPTWRY